MTDTPPPAHPADRRLAAPPACHPRLALIAAVARDGGIGRANALLWRDPEDQRRFRHLTLGAPVLMGRRTWDSLPERFRPLPGRRNLVLTRRGDWQAPGAEPVASLDAALALAREAGASRLSVIGGAEVYRLALPNADELLLTEVDATFDADTFFPPWERAAFETTAVESRVDTAGRRYRFVDYHRILPTATAATPR